MKRKAFTLVELLVIITIIGILIALLLPAIWMITGNAVNAVPTAETHKTLQKAATESYALNRATEAKDGWDKAIKVKINDGPNGSVVTASSAGVDGDWNTKDDIVYTQTFIRTNDERNTPE